MNSDSVYAVILAGGVGSRLWPKSRESSPKQLLHLMGDGTMIQNTVARLIPIVPPERIYIVTNEAQIPGFINQIPSIPAENLIAEPFGRNTAPCIALAAARLQSIDEEATMIVLPADHWIENVREFQNRIRLACELAGETKGLVTLGIRPSRPETGYGYIQWREENTGIEAFYDKGVRRVLTFAEKPDLKSATRFLRSGDFLWNSGMFVWKTSVIMDQFKTHLPDLFEQIRTIEKSFGAANFESTLSSVYKRITPISIDYGVMEKADNVCVIDCDFGWSDVGSWDETFRLSRQDREGNSLQGDVVAIDTTNSFIRSSGRMIASIGMNDVIIVDTDDALLVCAKGASQQVQGVVDYLRRKKINGLL